MGSAPRASVGAAGAVGGARAHRRHRPPDPGADRRARPLGPPGRQGQGPAQGRGRLLPPRARGAGAAPGARPQRRPAQRRGAAAAVPAVVAAPTTPATLIAEEKISVLMNREGGVESCDIKGTLSLIANKDEAALVGVTVNKAALASCTNNWTFATHPKVNKAGYEQNGLLALKDTRKGFPLNRPVGILRWSYSAADGAPITINCWPEDDGTGNVNVSIEYELTRTDMVLHDVNIMIPLGTTSQPQIESIDGNYKHDPREGVLCWHHELIDSNNAAGSLDFAISGTNADAFFPVTISFQSTSLLCPLELQSVASITNGTSVAYTQQRVVVPETYQCS